MKQPTSKLSKPSSSNLASEFKHPETGETILVNEKGGQGSDIDARFDLLPSMAMRKIAENLNEGAKKYAPWNWLNCPVDEHLNHVLGHINDYQDVSQYDDFYELSDFDDQKEALCHAATRAIMALEVHLRG
jgi:hypothetical protein